MSPGSEIAVRRPITATSAIAMASERAAKLRRRRGDGRRIDKTPPASSSASSGNGPGDVGLLVGNRGVTARLGTGEVGGGENAANLGSGDAALAGCDELVT